MNPTEHVLAIFERLSAIPRGSGHEEQVSLWLQGLAKENGLASAVDEIGNLIIRIPATPGRESAPLVVLQGHMDMVCEKTPDSLHDFTKDPIRCIVDGDWLHADHTTLGADNGVAIALALALVSDPSVSHPALELLFTVQEEVGLGGAHHLQPGFVTGKLLVNLDSEDEGTFIIGCAGGQLTFINLPLTFENLDGMAVSNLKITGLRGGHSGVDIHKHYASANHLLARVMNCIQKITPVRLISLAGGTAHNAISREAEVSFGYDAGQQAAIETAVKSMESILRNEYRPVDQDLSLLLSQGQPGWALNQSDSARAIDLWMAIPHGVAEMSAAVEGFVETSNNLARVELNSEGLKIITNQRSTVMTRMEELTTRIEAIGRLAGAQVSSGPAYPGWEPNPDSALLTRSVETYQQVFGQPPAVRLIHAGLECGTIGGIYPGMDMISLGATIENPHSPNERMNIPSIGRVWQYLVAFLNGI